MPLKTKTYEQFLSDQVSSLAASLQIDPNLKDGSVLKGIFQAATLGGDMFLQSQAKQNYLFARAQTSEGDDLDSFMTQFGLARKPAAYATGTVQVGVTQVQTSNLVLKPGTIVQTVGGSIQYQVVADTTQSAWSATQNVYILNAGSLNMNVTVQALESGSDSNVQAAQLVQFGSATAGLNTVTNVAPILNGAGPESDSSFRQRFVLGFNAVNAQGTLAAFLFAATSVPGVEQVTLVEDIDSNGNARDAFVLIVIDDGSGAPPSTLKDAVYAAVDAIRGAGIEIDVVGPTLTHVNVSVNIRIAAGASTGAVTLNVENAILDYINGLKIGDTLYISQIEKTIMNADANVVAIQPSSLVCAQADATPTNTTVYRTDNTRVTIGTY